MRIKHYLGYTAGIISIFVSGFFIGREWYLVGDLVQNTGRHAEPVTLPLSLPPFLSVEACDNDDLNVCFGSGRAVLTTTEHATVFTLIHSEGQFQYGVMDNTTKSLYRISID